MKNTGKFRIGGTLIKVIIITLIIFLVSRSYAQEITPKIITTQPHESVPGILNTIDRFYEISEKSLEIGYNVTLDTDAAFQTTIGQQDRYIVANNFSKNKINLIFLGSGKTIFNQPLEANNYVIFKIEDLNLQFTLSSANETHAEVKLKLFEQEIPENVTYFELFDIKAKLIKSTIYTPLDLSVIVEFINFGEGPSRVRLIYSIINADQKEVFTSIDEKIVETNKAIIKNFDTLDIPYGDYTLQTTIYYGDNQEATSKETFTLKEIPKIEIMKEPLFFIGIILISFILVIFFKRRKTDNTNLY